MDHGERTEENDSAPPKTRRPKYANSRLSAAAVVDELRTQFIQEIVATTPEVLEKLRDSVWPKYIEAYNAAKQPGANEDNGLVRFRWPEPLQAAVLNWAKDIRLLHRGKVPNWILKQVEVTLHLWARLPDLFSKRLHWGFTGGYSADGVKPVPDPFLIELPQFTWYWEQGTEDIESTKQRIMETVGEIVDKRLGEMKQVIENLPRVPNKRRREHFTWTVLHQVRGDTFTELAAKWNVSSATVKNEVMMLKASLGISLPKGRQRKNSIT
jgi:hypothetical protein